jgi:hypothetical protein
MQDEAVVKVAKETGATPGSVLLSYHSEYSGPRTFMGANAL